MKFSQVKHKQNLNTSQAPTQHPSHMCSSYLIITTTRERVGHHKREGERAVITMLNSSPKPTKGLLTASIASHLLALASLDFYNNCKLLLVIKQSQHGTQTL